MRPLRHRMELLALGLLRAAWAVMPERAAVVSGAFLGIVAGALVQVRRSDVDAHLRLAFPDRPRKWRARVSRGSYAHLGREAVVLFRGAGWDAARVLERTRVEGFDAFALEARKAGAVLLTGHLGNWEIGGAAIAARGIELDVVGKGMSNPGFQELLFARRRALGMRVIEMGDAPVEALRSLGRGRVVALLGDQSAHRGGVAVPFFGRPASTARGPALFAARSAAPVFVAFAIRDPGWPPRYTIRFERLPFEPSGDLDLDARYLLRTYTTALETAIEGAPDQYFWQHRRWKRGSTEEPASGR